MLQIIRNSIQITVDFELQFIFIIPENVMLS